MLHIKSLAEGLPLFKALGSEVRVEVVRILMEQGPMSMNELAGKLGLTNGALTSHIRRLEECGVVTISSESEGHGNQKRCSVQLDKILIDLEREEEAGDVYATSVKVGQFTGYDVYPTCGLATSSHVIGEVDDTRYFSHPERYDADILWFTRGFVEYQVANFVPEGSRIDELCLSAELSSEAPGVNSVWPSDIHFYMNDVLLGVWTSPGDFGDVQGIFTPDWWFPNWNQYGLLKMLVVNHKGTFIDGLRVSDTSIDDFSFDSESPIRLRFAVPEDAKHVGGLTIFGRTFGNYGQDIEVRIGYSSEEKNG